MFPSLAGAKAICKELFHIAVLVGRERQRVYDYYGSFFTVDQKISLNIVFTMGTVRDSEEVVANKEKEHLILSLVLDVFYAYNVKSFFSERK